MEFKSKESMSEKLIDLEEINKIASKSKLNKRDAELIAKKIKASASNKFNLT